MGEYVGALQEGGCVVNGPIISATLHGIISASEPSALIENGGHIDCCSRSLIQSTYRRYDLCKRKGTSGRAVINTEEILKVKNQFVKEINALVTEHEIPSELIINYDETGVPIIPTAHYTMAKKGAKTVNIKNKGIPSTAITQSFNHSQSFTICFIFRVFTSLSMIDQMTNDKLLVLLLVLIVVIYYLFKSSIKVLLRNVNLILVYIHLNLILHTLRAIGAMKQANYHFIKIF